MSKTSERLVKAEVGNVLKKGERLYIVASWDITMAGHVLEITLSPITDPLTAFFLWIGGRLAVDNDQIDEFELVGNIATLTV